MNMMIYFRTVFLYFEKYISCISLCKKGVCWLNIMGVLLRSEASPVFSNRISVFRKKCISCISLRARRVCVG